MLNIPTIYKKPVAIGALVFASLFALTQYLSYQRYLLNKDSEQREITNAANAAKERLQSVLNYSLATTKTLGFIIEKYGIPKDFDSVATQLLESNKFIDAIQLVKGGVITNVYPLKGNEAVIGYNILADTARNKEALKAIERKQLFFSGPFELKQGGIGVVGRQPIFRENKFWGFAAVIIKLPTILKAAGIDSLENNDFIFQLSKTNPNSHKEEFFLPQQAAFKMGHFVAVDVPDGEWNLYVQPKTPKTFFAILPFAILGIILSLTGAVFAWYFAQQPEKLEKLVKEKTQQLTASENNYRTVLERITDAFVALDKNWCYTFLNDAALATHPAGKEATIGKAIWDVHPEMKGTIFWDKYHEAMETGKTVGFESYYPPMDTWFSVKVYPSSDGLTIFYRDFTENKRAEEQLAEREQQLSLFVENSPAAIAMFDKEMKYMVVSRRWLKDYHVADNTEIIGKCHYDVFPEIPVRWKEVHQRCLTGGTSEKNEEDTFIGPDGSLEWLRWEVHPWHKASGEVGGIILLTEIITERKKMERKLMESEERYRLIYENSSEAILLTTTDGTILEANPEACRIFGRSEEEICKSGRQGLLNLNDPRLFQALEERQRKGKMKAEMTALKTNGTIFPIEVSSTVFIDSKGEERTSMLIRDLTEKKNAEDAIKASEEKYRSLVEQASDAIFIADTTGRFITVNTSACKLSQHSEKELLQMSIYDFAVMEDLQKNPFHFDELKKGKTVNTERVMKGKDGTLLHIGINAKLLSDGRLLTFVRDISEQIKVQNEIIREKNLSDSIINSLPGVFYLYNRDGKFLRWNKNFETITQYNADEIRGMHPLDFFDVDDKKLLSQKIKNVFNSGKDNVQADFLLKTREKIPYYFTGIVIDYEGSPCLMGVGIDFSERAKAQEKIKETTDQLRQLTAHLQNIREEERKRIGREIHDELGQQLTAIKMDVAWIDKKTPDETTGIKNKLKNIIGLLDGGNQSIRRILSELRPGVLDDQGLLDALEWQGRQFTESTGIPVKFSTTEAAIRLPEEIATCVFRVYQESLTNIMRYAKANKVLTSLSSSDDSIVFTIEDDGEGFDTAAVQNKKTFGILGMKERVLSLDGKFELISSPGKGTKIIISFAV